jgi:hypothetical protein
MVTSFLGLLSIFSCYFLGVPRKLDELGAIKKDANFSDESFLENYFYEH